jgi:MerR family transcriptional regulator, thiopeptide resistance regulator
VLAMSTSGITAGHQEAWKVGALARASGLTVRALHYYDHIGLLSPSMRTGAGHRLYSDADVARLYRIALLRRLGFPLEQITSVLDDPEWQLAAAVRRHLAHIRESAAAAARLCGRLADMATAIDREDHPAAGQLFATLEEMTMTDAIIRSTTGMLVYDDLAAAHDYIVGVYGLASAGIERAEDGRVIHAEVRAGDQIIMLHPSGEGYRSPRSLGAVSSMTIVTVDNVDAHHARSVQAGAVIVEKPVDQAYGVREYGARDPEGQLWYFHSPLD